MLATGGARCAPASYSSASTSRPPLIEIDGQLLERGKQDALLIRSSDQLHCVRLAAQAQGRSRLRKSFYECWRRAVLEALPALEHDLVPSAAALAKRHGGWPGVLCAAGVITEAQRKSTWRGRGMRVPDEVVTDALQMAAADLGRQFLLDEYEQWRAAQMRREGCPPLPAGKLIRTRPGGWRGQRDSALRNDEQAAART